MEKRYKVVICPHCGHVQMSSAEVTFSCVRCKKSRKLHSTTQIGLDIKVLASFDLPQDASRFIQEYKGQKVQDIGFSDASSY